MKINKEYSTKDLERILNQSKSILANRRAVLAYYYDTGIGNVVILRLTEDRVLPFDEWLQDQINENNLTIDGIEYTSIEDIPDDVQNELYNNAYLEDISFIVEDTINQIQPILDNYNNKLKAFKITLEDDEIYFKKWYKSAIRTVVRRVDSDYSEKWEALEIKRINNFLLKLANKFKYFEVDKSEI